MAGGNADAIMMLPISALRLPADMVDSLRKLGLDRISDLVAKPRAPLALRFGPELGRRLDQAMGGSANRSILSARRRSPRCAACSASRSAPPRRSPVSPANSSRSSATCSKRAVLAHAASIFCSIESTTASRRSASARPTPVRDAKRLTRLLTDKIETIDPGFGIELMRLAATIAEPLVAKQTISSLVETPEADVSDLIDTLANRVGEERLYRCRSGGERRAGAIRSPDRANGA